MTFDEKYAAWKQKKAEQSLSKDTSSQSFESRYTNWKMRNYGEDILNDISSRVNSWFANADSFNSTAKNRYSSNDNQYRGDTAEWLSKATQQRSTLATEAKELYSLLYEYKDYLDTDWLTQVHKALREGRQYQDQIVEAYTKDNKYWSQFDSADAYSKYLEDVKKYEAQEAEKAEMISTNLDEYNYYTNSIKLKAEYAQELENRLVEIESDLVHFPNDATLLKEKADIEKKLVGHSAQKYWSQVEERNAWSKRASYLQTGAKMTEEALKASDFGQYSKYASTKATGIWDNLTSLYGMGYKDLTYEYINGDESLRSEIIENSDKFSSDNPFSDGESSFEEKGYEYLDEKEKQIYNYYYAKEGKKKAEQYLDTLAEDLQERKAVKQFEKLEGRTGMEILFGIEAGIDQFTSGIKNLLADGDRYIPATSTQLTSGMVREDLADNGFKVLGSSLGQIGYDAVTNTANMLPSMLTSTVVGAINPTLGAVTGNLLLGASSAGNAYAEMINLGYSKGQARAYSALVGGSEAGLQYLLGGIGKLGGTSKFIENAVSKIDNTFGRVALGLLGNMASEGFEEGLQTVLEPWFKSVVGNVDFEAPDAEEVLYSSLLGALSAGVLEGGGAVAGGISTTATGKEIKSTDGALDRLTKLGSTMSLDSVAYKLAGKVNEKTGAYTIGRLFNEIGASMSEANKTDVANALMAKGMTDSDAWTISEWLASAVDGHTFNKKQIAALESNDVVSEVFRDVIIDQNSTVNQRIQGYSDIFKIADEVANGVTEESSEETTEPLKTTSVPRSFAPYSIEELTKREAAFRAMGIPEAEVRKMAQAQPNTFSEGESSFGNKTVSHREFSSSSDGKTILAKTGEEVQIKEVASTQDGQMTLKLTNGETVNAKDVSYSSSAEALVYEAVADMGVNPATATALIRGYDGQIPAKAYVLGIKEAYTYGKYNFPASEMSEKAFSATLSETQRSTAYKLGQIDEKARITTAQEKLESTIRENQTVHSKGGKLHYDGVSKMGRSKLQKTSLKALERVANALGIDIHLYESSVNEKGVRGYTTKDGKFTTANGWYDPKDGSIHLDINAGASGKGTMLFTAAHELTHFIKRWSPEKFKVLADFLMEKYGEKGVRVSELVQRQINKAKKNGRIISYDVAYEEVIADSMETMLSDGDVVSKLEEIKAKDRGLWEKIKEFVTSLCEKIKAMYADLNPDSIEGQYVKEMVDSMEQLKNLFTEALVDASDSYSSWIGTREISEFSEAKTTDGEALFQYRAMEEDKVTYRAMLKKHGLMTDTEIDDLFNMVDDAVDVIKNNLEVLDYAWDVDINDRAFMPVKPNSDSLYKVSLDFSTLCRKRLLQQTIQNMLQETLNKQLSKEEAISIRNELMKIQEEGRQIEIACALCYVESARMKSPAQIKKFLKNKETILIDFFAGKSGGSIKGKIKQAEADTRARLHAEHPEGIKGKDGTMLDPRTASLKAMPKKYADEIREAKRKAKASYQPTAHEAAEIEAAKTMKASDFTSPEGLENLAKNHPELFDAYTSFVRNATKSKGIEKDTWWRAGDSDTLIGQSLIDKMNAENGLRSQSWSDFQVIHLLDYIAATIELSTKNAKRQSYTKVPDYVRLLGNTGDMINMSLIPTRAYNGKLEYDPVEGMAYEVALELRKKHHATAGTICIGIHNDQIKALLADLDIDYVIPYHKSGMSAATRKLMHIPDWKDYEPYQIESMLSDADAKKNADKYGVKLLDKSDEMYHAHTNFSEWFDLEEARQIAKMENANPSDMKAYKKYGDMYGAYKAMQNSANNYLKLCAERGIAPKFSHPEADFTQEENYWKLLIDRKMVDNITGEIIEQKAIKPIFRRDDVLGILNDELARYPEIKKDQDYATRKVVQKFLSGQMKVDKDTLEAIKKPVDNVTKVNIMESSELLLSDRDSSYMDAVNRGDMEAAQKMVDEAAKKAGYTVKAYHGTTGFGFTKVDTSKGDDGISFFATDSVETAGTYSGTQDVKKIAGASKQTEEERDTIITEIYSAANDLAEHCNRTLGIRGWVDYDYFDRQISESIDDLEYGVKASDVKTDFLSFCDDLFYTFTANYYDTVYDDADHLGWEEWEDTEEYAELADDFYNRVDRISEKFSLLDYDSSQGIYDLYANTEGLFEIDAQGKRWNAIPFESSSGSYLVNTRRLASYAKAEGYKGVKITNVFDDGGKSSTHQSKPATVYIFFNPQEQVKSADTVTYDDNGNVIPLSERFKSENDDIRYSVREIVGDSGTNYGVGVYLDSELLTNLTEDERIKMVKEYVKELGGSVFTAYDSSHNAVDVHIAEVDKKFKNKSGKRVLVNKDLTTKSVKNKVKQESIALIDELLLTSAYDSHKAASYPHGWLDNYGKNDWEYWITYLQDKENTIWEATLNVATSANGEKILYDINPIKKVERSVKSDTIPTNSIISQTDDFVNTQDENILLSDRVTDKETIEFLENQEHIVTYKAMQVIDGKLYPPMAAKVKDENGRYKLSNPSQLGVWQQATEDTKNIKKIKNGVGYYSLNKGVGSPVEAAYNPYEHSSNLVLNDQFESAYLRDNLVVVECVIPSSEMSSGYKAQYAKDTTGVMDWKAGVVAGKIKNNKRKVYLSRYLKPVRILSDAEVASKYKEVLEGTGVSVPFNVVHPSLLAELEKVGVDIDYDGSPMYQSIQKRKAEKDDISYQEREADTSNRAILANAFESVAQNDIEKQKIAEYKEKISLIEEEQRQLAETRAKIKEISFSKGKRDEKLLKSLKFDAVQSANRINTYDKQLLRLEASKPLADVLSREKYKVKRRMEQKSREALAEQRKVDRERMEKKLAEVSARNQESRHRAVENRNRTELRHKIKNVVSELNKLLLNGSKEHNVKINLQKATAEALMAVNMDTVNAEERLANIQSQIDKEMAKETPDMAKVKKLKESYDNVEAMGEKMTARLTALKDAYEQIKDSDDPLIAKSYDEAIALRISNLRDKVGDTPLRSMTLEQLEFVYDTYRMVLTTIRDANKAFNENIKMTRLQLGSNTFAEIKDNNKARETIKHENLEKFMWQNLKPMTAMKTIGSKTLQMLYNELLYGQEVFAKDYDEAVKFAEESKKKHGYDKWDMSKTYSFQSKSGKVMKLNLEQMMSVYAYSKRKQADAHIEKGGIVLNESVYKVKDKLGRVKEIKVNDSNAYRLSKDQVAHIVDTLEKVAPNSKAFVDEMQKYLSDTMGAKGNEVSLKMYGIKLFKETHYFPLKSSKEFMEAANTKLKGDVKIKNKGMTKETVPDAKNPIVLEGFLDVWGNHVNEMSLYHGLVLPLEDFSRTINYSFRADEKANVDGESINKVLHDAFGESATDYLHNLMKHINGGVLRDSTTTFADKAISKFKKGAVMASLSVVVQQPTAIVRAMAHINPKYFVHSPNLHHFETWEELKKYCPTAIIKETGSFDTNMGRSIVEMVKDEKTAMTRIDDFLSWLPAHADVMGWNMIWKALKNKIATEQKLSGEALLKAAGKQMTLIINETQVYDSVMARSELMRSKDGLSKMATSFMAEPIAVANMVYGAGLDLKRGQVGKASATVAAVMSSIVLNSIVSSLVYALRDDDEDRTYWEKYLESLTTEVVDGFNPLTYIPYIKDVYSVFQGYDVKRTDMSIFADLNDSLTKFYKLFEFDAYEDKSEKEIADYVYDNLTPVIGSICNMFGLPLENVLRDTKAVFYNSWHSLPASQGTGAETWYAFRQGILNAKPKLYSKIFGTVTKSDKVYEAILSGDEKQIARIKSQYKTEEAFETAIRKALRENEPRIKEAAIARFGGDIETYKRLVTEIVKEGHFKQDFVVGAVNTAMNELDKDKEETEEEYEKQTSIFSSEDLNASLERGDIESAKEIIADLVKVKTENNFAKAKAEAEKNGKKFNEKQALKEAESKANSSVKSSMTSHWKPLYKKAYRENNTDEMKRIRELLYASGIYGRASEVVETVKKWLKED